MFDDFLNLNEDYIVPLEPFNESQQNNENIIFRQKIRKLLGKTVDYAFDCFKQIEVYR